MEHASKPMKRAEALKEMMLCKDHEAPLNFKKKSRWSLVRTKCYGILFDYFLEREQQNILRVVAFLEEDIESSKGLWGARERFIINYKPIDFYAHLVVLGCIKDALKNMLARH